MNNDKLIIAGKEIKSRFFAGTGKFSSSELMVDTIKSSGADIVTVAVRRLNEDLPGMGQAMDYLSEHCTVVVNTSGAYTAAEAVKIAKIATNAGLPNWVKVELTPDPRTLLPDPIETLKACEELVKLGFVVLPYINTDPILAKRLEDIGVAAVMPLGSMIGTNKGIIDKEQMAAIIDRANIPVVIDAGIGRPSHASEAMEMGADAVLANSALAVADNSVLIGEAFKLAVEAGRKGYLSGLPEQRNIASASSPLTGFLD